MEDIPGVGKTTLAVAFSKALGLTYKRFQFTPDVMPSDLTGFSIYNKDTGSMDYQPGGVGDLGHSFQRVPPLLPAEHLHLRVLPRIAQGKADHEPVHLGVRQRLGADAVRSVPAPKLA